MKNELLKGLSEEQIKRVKECKNQEELLELAKKEGVSLSDEQLEAVSGGGCSSSNKCPKCGSKDFQTIQKAVDLTGYTITSYKCKHCGNQWQ